MQNAKNLAPISSRFFHLHQNLCRLYLSSGKSHVPYLWNRPDNPINTVKLSAFLHRINPKFHLISSFLAHEQGRWSTVDVHQSDPHAIWTEPLVSWGEPVYPEIGDAETPQVLWMKKKVGWNLYLVQWCEWLAQ